MNHQPAMTADRREAVSRAASAVVRLQVEPSVREAAKDLNRIVNDPERDDWDAWEAVRGLEHTVLTLGLATWEDLDYDRQRLAYRALTGD